MIAVKVLNADQVIAERKGKLISSTLSFVGQSENVLDYTIAEKIKQVLEAEGVEVEVNVVKEQRL